MKCPFCSKELQENSYHEIETMNCPTCKGTWLPGESLPLYIQHYLKDHPELKGKTFSLKAKKEAQRLDLEFKKKCPVCDINMDKVNYYGDSNIIIDKCKTCKGTWLDADEIRRIAVHSKVDTKVTSMGHEMLKHQREIHDSKELNEELSKIQDDYDVSNPIALGQPVKLILPLYDDITKEKLPIVTTALMSLCILTFFISVFTDFSFFIDVYGLSPVKVLRQPGQYTLISSLFLHGSIYHLAGNMLYLWIFGNSIENKLGHIPYLLGYLAWGIISGIIYAGLNYTSDTLVIGASSAISGVLGAYFIFFPKAKIKTLIFRRTINIPSRVFIGIWITFQLFMIGLNYLLKMEPGVSYLSHIAGFILGIISGLIIQKKDKK